MRLPEISQQNMTCPLPWQPYSSQTTTNAPVNISVHPASLAKHPRQWTKEEVGVWLRWCTEEFSIEAINPDKFDLNGKALCLLSRSDFLERLPKNGDVLYNCLQSLINKSSGGGVLYQPNFSFGATSVVETTQLYKEPVTSFPSLPRAGLIFVPSASTCPSTLPYSHSAVPTRSYVPIKPYPTTQEIASRVPTPIKTTSVSNTTGFGENEEKPVVQQEFEKNLNDKEGSSSFKDFLGYPFQSVSEASSPSFTDHKLDIPRHQRSSDCRLLWEFIYQLLMNSKYSSFVSWENREDYVFRIVNPTGLAELWGQQKNRTNMTYEKLSRALRYYYRMNIIKKVQGKRLTYKFLQPPSCIQKGQRGAKPHGRVQVSYGEISPSHNDPSLSDVRCPDYDSDANSLTDHSMDGFEEDQKDTDSDLSSRGQGHILKANSSRIKGSDSPSASMDDHNFSDSRNQNEASRVELDSYHMDLCRLQNDRFPPTNPFHLTSSVFDTYPARFNLHYRGTEPSRYPTVYKPSPTYPVLGCNNLLGPSHSIVKDERFDCSIVPPAHSNSPKHKAQSSHENLKRSLSYDLSTLHVPKFPHRPNQARSASPRKDLQIEPEDLSVKKINDLQDVSKFVKTEIVDHKEEKTKDGWEMCDHGEERKLVDEKQPT